MIAYIIRRVLYAVPTVIGVNVIVFMLFFYISNPDQMAERHLGAKRINPELIDEWKREHALNLPYFYNKGWRSTLEWSLSAAQKENKKTVASAGPGHYALVVETPQNEKLVLARSLRISAGEGATLSLPSEFDADGRLELPAAIGKRRFEFDLAQPEGAAPASLDIAFDLPKLESETLTHRVVLEFQEPIGATDSVVETIFFQRSVKMLWLDFGKSDRGNDIKQQIFERMGPSLAISVPALVLGLLLEIFFAMLLAFFRGTYVDYWGVVLCVLMMSISVMFYILGMQVLVSKYWHLFPISGYAYGSDAMKFVALPILIAVIGSLGGSVRFYRTIFLEEINKDYVRTARSKGLAERSVLFVHVLKNAMIPILTGVVVSLPFLFTGSLVLESFFAIPGLGSYTIDAIQNVDFAIVQAMVALGAYLYILGLLMTDISYTLVDPRVRLE